MEEKEKDFKSLSKEPIMIPIVELPQAAIYESCGNGALQTMEQIVERCFLDDISYVRVQGEERIYSVEEKQILIDYLNDRYRLPNSSQEE